ncbi:hypothetical protein [Candidatus Uabimicrobium sp. HlEnr_7]|uniref:hypothetical protein n=1 Tax=Candidatus Uabimicrobium helgolandensis TaxID=3095367 RepID=UPI00355651A4
MEVKSKSLAECVKKNETLKNKFVKKFSIISDKYCGHKASPQLFAESKISPENLSRFLLSSKSSYEPLFSKQVNNIRYFFPSQ